MTKKTCPLGEDCDLPVAWMAGRENAKDEAGARIEELEAKLAKAVGQMQRVKDYRYDPNIGIELNRLEEAIAELKEDQ